jgi:hypothetical protein
MLVAVIGGLVGIGIAYAKYIKQNQVPDEDAAITGLQRQPRKTNAGKKYKETPPLAIYFS